MMIPENAKSGTRVRVIGQPERTGSVSNEPREINGTWSVKVDFDDGVRRVTRLENLETIPFNRDVVVDIQRGQLEGPQSLRRNLLHEKLNGRLTEVVYSMDTSNTTFYAYQFKPVLKLLESPTNSLLIADEVGLGKTIEAGLIWTELKAREGARFLLVVCPPHLVTKWRNELKRRFGVDSQRADASDVREKLEEARRGHSPGFALVASYHSLRPPKNWDEKGSPAARLAQDLYEWGNKDEPILDLLVMDEAAIMRNEESQTSELGGLFAPVSRNKIYLSATPLHTRTRNLYTLLKRLDPETFTDEHTFNSILEANEPLVHLREMILAGKSPVADLLERVDRAAANPLLEGNNTLRNLRIKLTEAESLSDPRLRADLAYQSERANLLSYVVTRTRKRDADLRHVEREVRTVLVPLTTSEKALYEGVTEAVRSYALERDIGAGFLTVMPQRQVASCMAAACAKLVAGESEDAELNPDVTWSGKSRKAVPSGPLVTYIRENLAGRFRPEDFQRHDSKYTCLLNALKTYRENHPGGKLVLFAFFKPTLYYLADRLGRDGIETLMLTGDDSGDKQLIVDEFSKPASAPILLSSEVGSEGLDLQFAAAMVNYDLPWNPMVVEQRIGRIHRIGQQAERIIVINLVCEGTVDQRIYDRLYDRLDLFKRTIGDLEAVIGPLINELTNDILTHRLSDTQLQERIERTAVTMEQKIQQEEQLERDASVLAAYGDYVINQISAAHARKDWITGDDLEAYLLGFFHRNFPATRLQGIDQANSVFEIELCSDALHEFDRFLSARTMRGQTRLTTSERRHIRFDHRVFTPAERGIEVIHQSHPLVRFAGHHQRVNRVVQPVPVAADLALAHCPEGVSPGIYAFVTQRWSVDGIRNYERIQHEVRCLADGNSLEDPQLASAIVELSASLGSATAEVIEPGDPLLDALADFIADLEIEAEDRFHQFEQTCISENEDRKHIQIRGVERFEQRRREGIEKRRELHRAVGGRESLVAAMDGQLLALRKRSSDQREKIIRKSQTRGDCGMIAAGFIRIHA